MKGFILWLQVLVKVHEDVIPHLSNPLQLADLLSRALDAGGFLGMTALHAIFVLVTKYGLEYPQFYVRLYQLLKPEVFLVSPWDHHHGNSLHFSQMHLSEGSPPGPPVLHRLTCVQRSR